MRNGRFYIALTMLLTMLSHSSDCQLVISSHSSFTRTLFNPAYAGEKEQNGAYLNYRNQWADFSGNTVLYRAGYTQYINSIQGGVGLMISNNTSNRGLLSDLTIDGIYAYALQIARQSYLHGAIQIGYGSHHVNSEKIIFGDMFDPRTEDFSNPTADPYQSSHHHYLDIASGILLHHWDHRRNTTLESGFSVHHLTEPFYTENSRRLRQYHFHLSYRFPFYQNRMGRNKLHLEPAAYYRHQAHTNELMYGIHLHMPQYYAGLLSRQNISLHLYTVILSAGFHLNNYTLAYSFDMTFGSPYVHVSNLGAHEVTFFYKIAYKGRRTR